MSPEEKPPEQPEQPKRKLLRSVAYGLVEQTIKRSYDPWLKLGKESVVAVVSVIAILTFKDLAKAINKQTEGYAALQYEVKHHMDEEVIAAATLRLSAQLGLDKIQEEAEKRAEKKREERAKDREQEQKKPKKKQKKIEIEPAKAPKAAPVGGVTPPP